MQPYHLKKRLGAGWFGEVHLAEDWRNPEQPQSVAIKFTHDGSDLPALLNEHRVLTHLQTLSPALPIPRLHAFIAIPQGKAGLMMSYIEGQTLNEALESASSVKEVLTFAGDVLTAIAAVHTYRVVHRDLHTHNVLIPNAGGAMLIDFGAATGQASEEAVHADSWRTFRLLVRDVFPRLVALCPTLIEPLEDWSIRVGEWLTRESEVSTQHLLCCWRVCVPSWMRLSGDQ